MKINDGYIGIEAYKLMNNNIFKKFVIVDFGSDSYGEPYYLGVPVKKYNNKYILKDAEFGIKFRYTKEDIISEFIKAQLNGEKSEILGINRECCEYFYVGYEDKIYTKNRHFQIWGFNLSYLKKLFKNSKYGRKVNYEKN